MPKLKTRRSALKRFKVTGTGKILRNKAFKSHLLTHKSSRRKRRLRHKGLISQVDKGNIKRLIPYSL